ncbi:MAG: short-chain dehydrogenase/reductase [Rhodospirillales bacterium]|nr:short-chain dehydrogenase/reductase [Rhodospirillales bacterium]
MPLPRPGTLIVTGASRGIGAAVAVLAGRQGWRVAVNYARDLPAALTVVATIREAGGMAEAIQGDISREADILNLFRTAEAILGPLGGLVNNAGITGGFARIDQLDAGPLAQVLAVNVAGPILCAREAVRRLSTRHDGKGGAIVNISSLAARTGGAGEWVHYAPVAPGLIETDLHAANGAPDRPKRMASSIPMKRAGTASEVAEGVIWLLSPAASYTTGTILEIGGGR